MLGLRSASRRATLAVGLLALGAGARPAVAGAFPGANGRIVFQSDRDGNAEIYSAAPDGTDVRRLTTNAAADTDPVVSADGRRIAFVSTRDGSTELYTMAADGLEVQRVTTNAARDEEPGWSPDGARLVFTSDRDGNPELYSTPFGGGSAQRLTTSPGVDSEAAWSPDGRTIAFTSTRDDDLELYTMAADGSGQTRRTTSPNVDASPAWSPDGTRLAFRSRRADGDDEVWTSAVDGTLSRRVTTSPGFDGRPAFSPDGSRLVFASERDGQSDVYAAAVNGAEPVRLSPGSAARDDAPDWGVSTPRRPSTTAITCAATGAGTNARCTATVRDDAAIPRTPTGTVGFSANEGTFAPDGCTLRGIDAASASCEVGYARDPGSTQDARLVAAYGGDQDHEQSVGGAVVGRPAAVGDPAGSAPVAPADPRSPVSVLEFCQGQAGGPSASTLTLYLGTVVFVPPTDPAQRVAACQRYWSRAEAARTVALFDQLDALVDQALARLTANGERFSAMLDALALAAQERGTAELLRRPVQGRSTGAATRSRNAAAYETLARVRAVGRVRTRLAGSRRSQREIAALITDRRRAIALGDAFTTSVQRAQAARAAGSTLWQGRQTRAAIDLSGRLATALDRVRTRSRAAARAARGDRAPRGAVASEAALRRLARRVACSGFTARERRTLAALGFSPSQTTAARTRLRTATAGAASRTLAGQLADPDLLALHEASAAAVRYWAGSDEVRAAAALR